VEINSAWEMISENIKMSVKESLGYFEFKKHRQWSDIGCSKLLDAKKSSKLQWLNDSSKINGNYPSNVICEGSRHLRNKKCEYVKDKINELVTYSNNKNIRDVYRRINEFKMGYQSRNNFAEDENGGHLAGSHIILNR
jgi:hypothetical protein